MTDLRARVEAIFEDGWHCLRCPHYSVQKEYEHLSGRAVACDTFTKCDLLDPPYRRFPMLSLEECPGLEDEIPPIQESTGKQHPSDCKCALCYAWRA